MLLGYARVSTQDQNLDRQLDELRQYGCEKIYEEKVTGTHTDRTELNKLLENARAGDTVIIMDLTRLSRSTKDLFALVEQLGQRSIDIKSLKEAWIDTTTPQGKLMFTIFAGIAQFERDLLSQRTKEGLAAAKARGRQGGRPRTRNEKAHIVIALYKQGVSQREIAKQTELSRSTIKRIINDMK
ncbi:MAG: recombinase family protein [Clostridiales bacterium]|jgi:DNA invertase Pin-like site-specific DNA recombinase|nr:recombinase family protein [Clostridiales bacterium]